MRILKIVVFFIGITSFAQSKVGVVDVDFILNQLPEIEEVKVKMNDYTRELDKDFSKMLGEYNELRDEYEAKREDLSEEKLREKQEILIEKEMDIQKFQQNSSKLIEIQKQEYLGPLYQKIGAALNKVAAEQNFTIVQELTTDVVYLQSEYNLTVPILNELGIELSEDDIEE